MQTIAAGRQVLLLAGPVPRDARRRLLVRNQAAVTNRRVGLEAPRLEVGLGEPIDEHLRDARALLWLDRFLLDDRRHGQNLAIGPAHLVLEPGDIARVLR